MESKYGSRRKPSSGRGLILGALFSFVAGGLLTGYVVWHNFGPNGDEAEEATSVSTSDDPTAVGAIEPAPSPIAEAIEKLDTDNPEEAAEVVELVAEQQGGLDQRLAAAEQRLAQLALQSQAAAGNAARAEGLLIAFATRRLIERGDELGSLAQQLQLRFGDDRPNAVNAIINFSRREQPLRIDVLIARLDGLKPQLTATDEGPSFESFWREVRSLFVIRRKSTATPQAESRLERAKIALEQGRYQSAINEVKAMPGSDDALDWIADAEEYMLAMQALENIELAAVLDQSSVRDGQGNKVNELNAAGASSEN
ncbi:MAG: hypothetical protein AAF687_01150 [Pseudomonadota bacterium]